MIHELEKEKMDSIKALADTNMKISEARDTLSKLKTLEVAYLAEREKKAMLLIEQVMTDSKGMLDTARQNYEEFKIMMKTATEFSAFLSESYKTFELLVHDFDEQNVLWSVQVKAQVAEFDKIKENIKADKLRLKNDKESLERYDLKLAQDVRKILDDRGTVDRMIKRLKEGKI